MAEPLSCWADDLSVYTLYEWVEGQDMNEVASDLPDSVLYELGCQAGKFLRACMVCLLIKVCATGTVFIRQRLTVN